MPLYLIPVPLADHTAEQVLPAQIKETVGALDIFFVENLRTARRFISALQLGKTIDELTFFDLHKDTPEADTLAQLKTLHQNGQSAGVLSEAGCPGIADPGAVAVKIAHQLGMEVVPLVGPSSILLALMASGLNGQSFVFHGYLPIGQQARAAALRKIEKEAKVQRQTQIFIETPYRNTQLFQDLLEVCAPSTQLCVACNLTAPDAFVKTLPIAQWKKQLVALHKKPTIFLIG
jgi:16S rRNA (cytidine1402-2'-O)-methyltransferase